ncbi:MAG TPA: hypothetical protein VK907_07050, partial [Phnomibacter sp.]|nr:hypothetical protein [Phnomibacter sp.]
MKKLLSIIVLGLMLSAKPFAQNINFVLNNPSMVPNPGVFPGGTETIEFDFFLQSVVGPYNFSSNDLSNNYGFITFSFTKLDPTGITPSGTGAAFFNWTLTNNGLTGVNRVYTWTGTTKTISMQPSPPAAKYKIRFENVPITFPATKAETDIRVAGQWTDPGGVSSGTTIFEDNFAAIATYTCTPVNAGADGSTTVCDNSTAAINLFDLITGEEPGGTWARTGGAGGTFNAPAGTFTPAPGATTSTFTYTIAGVNDCPGDQSVATVNIVAQVNAGADGNTSVCDNSTNSIDLFSLITGEQGGGTWARTTGTGGTFSAANGTFTPAPGATTSTFTYTVTGTAPCPNDESVATVNITPQANAGTGSNTTTCAGSNSVINLYDLLTGEQPGGTWTRQSGTGGIFDAIAGTFTVTANATTSTFRYTVTGVSPCPNDQEDVTVNVTSAPTAGTGGSTTVCDNSVTAIDLFSLLTGEDPGGTWTRQSGTGGSFNDAAGTFTPAAGATTSVFRYTIGGTGGCPTDQEDVTVNIVAQANAGQDGSTSVCDNSTSPINLFSLITGEQGGGTWTRTTGTGGTFDAGTGTFTPAPGATTSTFTYTVTGTAPCPNDESVATVNITPQANAGTGSNTTACAGSNSVINLYDLLTGEQPGGTWTRQSGTGG